MAEKAEEFSEEEGRQHYLDALPRFRLPYWDPVLPRRPWNNDDSSLPQQERFRNIFGMPEILSAQEVQIMVPGQKEAQSIENPLYKFTFPSDDEYAATKRSKVPWAIPGDDAGNRKQNRVSLVRAALQILMFSTFPIAC